MKMPIEMPEEAEMPIEMPEEAEIPIGMPIEAEMPPEIGRPLRTEKATEISGENRRRMSTAGVPLW